MRKLMIGSAALVVGTTMSGIAMAGILEPSDSCKVPRGALVQLEKGNYDKYLKILGSANTDKGGGNGSELVFLSGVFCESGIDEVDDEEVNVDTTDSLAPIIITDPGNSDQ